MERQGHNTFGELDTRGGLVYDDLATRGARRQRRYPRAHRQRPRRCRRSERRDGGPEPGVSHVFYSDLTRQELRHAWWNGSEWTFETLDGDRTLATGRTDGETGLAPAVVNLNGVLHVFYSGLEHRFAACMVPGGQWEYETLDGSTAAAGHCTGYTTQRVFGPTAATVVGTQLYAVSSTNLSYPLLRVAEYR